MATVIIPTPLRKFTGNLSKLDVSAGTVHEAILSLSSNFPDLKKHLLDESGQIRSFLNIFIGEDDIRDLENEHTALPANAVLSIIPAIAGGAVECGVRNAECGIGAALDHSNGIMPLQIPS